MSTKLNAEELAAKLYPLYFGNDQAVYDRITAAHTIRAVAQPIADERDEYREALELLLCGAKQAVRKGLVQPQVNGGIILAEAAIAKYPKP